MESWRGREGGQIWDTNMEQEEEECPVSPQTLGGQSRLGTPWPEGWGGERAWGGKERTWCLLLLLLVGASTGFVRVSGLLESPLLCLSAAHRQQQG